MLWMGETQMISSTVSWGLSEFSSSHRDWLVVLSCFLILSGWIQFIEVISVGRNHQVDQRIVAKKTCSGFQEHDLQKIHGSDFKGDAQWKPTLETGVLEGSLFFFFCSVGGLHNSCILYTILHLQNGWQVCHYLWQSPNILYIILYYILLYV